MGYFSDKQDVVARLLARYPDTPQGRRSALMPFLREVQNAFGYVSEAHMEEVGSLVGTTATEVRSVMSFYSTYSAVPTGRYHIQVCSTLMCALAGSDELWDHLTETLDVQPGEVTRDGLFSVQKVECLGSCGTAPMLQINDAGYGYVENVTPRRCQQLLADLRAGAALPPTPVPVSMRDGHQVTASGDVVGQSARDLTPMGGTPLGGQS